MNYLPAESDTGMFGGNSNWRGPIWMPVNAMLIRALLSYYLYYGDNFKIECPTGSGNLMNLFEVAGKLPAVWHESSCATNLANGPCTEERRSSRRIPTGRITFSVLRVLPWRQRRRSGSQPPDRMDRARGEID